MRNRRTRVAVRRALAVGLPAAAAVAVLAGVVDAGAVSGGGYSPARQGCSRTADRNDDRGAQPGCHNATLQVGGGPTGWHLATVNTDQTANGHFVHSGSVTVDPGRGHEYVVTFDKNGKHVTESRVRSARGPDLAGLLDQGVYLGADDNLDQGEHDSVNPDANGGNDAPVANGPSDGGAVQVNSHPVGSTSHPRSLLGNVDPTDPGDPVRAADAWLGGCADGVCFGADTMRRTVYDGGCSGCAPQPVYGDQHTTDWRSPKCNSGDTPSQDRCGRDWRTGSDQGDIRQPYDERGAYYDDPGVYVYEDPDPQSSPALPVYPLCELYAGTEGVWVCSRRRVPAPLDLQPPAAPVTDAGGSTAVASAVPASAPTPTATPGAISPAVSSDPATSLP